VIGPAGDHPPAGEEYRVSDVLPNYGLSPVASGTLGADGRITIENVAANGASEYGGQYWVEVGGGSAWDSSKSWISRRDRISRSVQQLWSPEDKSSEKANARAAYTITGMPTAFLIDRDGRIVWRGHPASLDAETKIEPLLAGAK
jgi:hypothetical protein